MAGGRWAVDVPAATAGQRATRTHSCQLQQDQGAQIHTSDSRRACAARPFPNLFYVQRLHPCHFRSQLQPCLASGLCRDHRDRNQALHTLPTPSPFAPVLQGVQHALPACQGSLAAHPIRDAPICFRLNPSTDHAAASTCAGQCVCAACMPLATARWLYPFTCTATFPSPCCCGATKSVTAAASSHRSGGGAR